MACARSGDPYGACIRGWCIQTGEVHVEGVVILLVGVEGTIEEVETLETDFELLALVHIEVLEDADLIIEVGRSMDVGQAEGAIVSDGRRRKTGRVEVLVRLETATRIAGNEWLGGLVRSSGNGVVRYGDAGCAIGDTL